MNNNNLSINNDVDLYYYLNLNNNSRNNDKTISDDSNKFDIHDYEKLIEEIYSDEIDLDDNISENNLINQPVSRNNCSNPNININIKKPITRKKIFCEECQNDDIIEDTSQGILVCKGCGQVIDSLMDTGAEWTQYNDDNKKDMNRCSHPISQLLPQSSIATTIGGSCSSRIKTLHGWSAMPYKERSLNEVFKIIQKKCQEGKIMKCIEDDAKIMYKNISDCKHIEGKNEGKAIIKRGKNRMSIIAATVLFACRKKGKTRSPKEIAELFGLKYTEITKGCKIFQNLAKLKNMELNLNVTKPEHFIIRFCDELKIKKEYTEQAIQISNNVQKLQIASVHTPLSLATGSIYMMIQLNNLDIQKKVIADKFNVSQVTIAKAYKKLEPFMDLLTNDHLCDRLSVEIKKYQDNIDLTEELKPKFIRFNIDIPKSIDKYSDNSIVYDIIKKKPTINDILGNTIESIENNNFEFINEIVEINDNLIMEHDIEIDNKMKQLDNKFLKLKMSFTEDLYKILSSNK
jgi:transcription initiation factor TFIIIB Brf1 subunit/transcription initiation factor TFIIB